jgi:hypothetical protein
MAINCVSTVDGLHFHHHHAQTTPAPPLPWTKDVGSSARDDGTGEVDRGQTQEVGEPPGASPALFNVPRRSTSTVWLSALCRRRRVRQYCPSNATGLHSHLSRPRSQSWGVAMLAPPTEIPAGASIRVGGRVVYTTRPWAATLRNGGGCKWVAMLMGAVTYLRMGGGYAPSLAAPPRRHRRGCRDQRCRHVTRVLAAVPTSTHVRHHRYPMALAESASNGIGGATGRA